MKSFTAYNLLRLIVSSVALHRQTIPTLVGIRDTAAVDSQDSVDTLGNILCGPEVTQAQQGVAQGSLMVTCPMEKSVVRDWQQMEALW